MEAADLVVVGSGAAGLSAALAAASTGADVLVCERAGELGGTTAVSYGVVWAPGNHRMEGPDRIEDAERYLDALSGGKGDGALRRRFLEEVPGVVRSLEGRSPLRFAALEYPDYSPDVDGAREGGRSLEPEPLEPEDVGDLAGSVRPSPHVPVPVVVAEIERDGAPDFDRVGERMMRGTLTGGRALIGGLVAGCAEHGVRFRRGARVRELLRRDGQIVGVRLEDGEDLEASRGVVLASGGFEWDPELCRAFLRGPMDGPASPPGNTGDALRMVMSAGAALSNMSEAWWVQVFRDPNETFEGEPLWRLCVIERSRPGSILVNRAGRRFCNESQNYNVAGAAFHVPDPIGGGYVNRPAWLVFDRRFKDAEQIMTISPGADANWIPRASTLRELAGRVGIDPDGLEGAVERFNRHAERGEDPDFGRGANAYDRYNGDRSREGALRCLRPLIEPPFFAIEVGVGCLGTKGGPRTDGDARVLDLSGEPIPGLYAAGNAMGGVTGMGYGGAGGTIAPALVFGWLAGAHAGTG